MSVQRPMKSRSISWCNYCDNILLHKISHLSHRHFLYWNLNTQPSWERYCETQQTLIDGSKICISKYLRIVSLSTQHCWCLMILCWDQNISWWVILISLWYTRISMHEKWERWQHVEFHIEFWCSFFVHFLKLEYVLVFLVKFWVKFKWLKPMKFANVQLYWIDLNNLSCISN